MVGRGSGEEERSVSETWGCGDSLWKRANVEAMTDGDFIEVLDVRDAVVFALCSRDIGSSNGFSLLV